MAITQGRSSATDTLTGTDIKSHTLTFSGAGNFNVGATSPTGFGTIYSSAGSGNVVMSGAGTLTFSDKNTFTGTTTINSGTLSASAAGALGNTSGITVNSGGTLLLSGSSSVTDRINNTATVTLNGGTFNTGGLSEHGSVGIGALTLQNSSTIDFFNNGATSSVINFANSSAATWASGKILTIADWTGSQAGGGADQLIFGSDSTGLNASQIAEIQFVNPGDLGPGTYGAMILGTGEIVPVPEPGTWAAAALALAVLGYQFPIIRRRKLSRA
jgi:autotransporter-associated beta strand protein